MKKGIRIRLYIEDLDGGKRYGTTWTATSGWLESISPKIRGSLSSTCAKMADKVITEYIRRRLIRIVK